MQNFISIIDALKEHVTEYPDFIAIKFLTQKGYEILTYKELDQQARRLAHQLQQHGSYYNECAVILLPPGLEYIVAFLPASMQVSLPFLYIRREEISIKIEYSLFLKIHKQNL